MQVADEGEFGGLLAGPAALGLDTALDLDEVNVFQADRFSVPAHCVGDAELVDVRIIGAPVVGIAPVKRMSYPQRTVAILIFKTVFEARCPDDGRPEGSLWFLSLRGCLSIRRSSRSQQVCNR